MNKPKCAKCGKQMKNATDTHTGKISKYIWEFDCKCSNSKLRLIIG